MAREPRGSSRSVRAVRASLAAVAATDSTVLLTGETGTGKGLVARAIHRRSGRRDAPFVHVDCAALSATVIESELFGHERGAYTGASERRAGRFERAGAGTLFLDEVAELAPPLQAKLLRVLEDREYERVGGTCTLPMRARVLAATSRNLVAAVREGDFRPDLFYRLAVVELRLPPLRERLDDLPELVTDGLSRIATRLGVAAPRVGADFLEGLRRRAWPGNVRELMNLLERLLVQGRGAALDARALEEAQRPGAVPTCPAPHPARDDPEVIARTLAETGGNVARAARRLGLARSTLRHRIARHRLEHMIPRD